MSGFGRLRDWPVVVAGSSAGLMDDQRHHPRQQRLGDQGMAGGREVDAVPAVLLWKLLIVDHHLDRTGVQAVLDRFDVGGALGFGAVIVGSGLQDDDRGSLRDGRVDTAQHPVVVSPRMPALTISASMPLALSIFCNTTG